MDYDDRIYLGDSVYGHWHPEGVTLTTENGLSDPSNIIYLDSEVYETLVKWVERRRRAYNER